jgi:hypothetical protein
MDRAALQQNLRMARVHVALGDEHIQRQRQLIEELERDGHDTGTARQLLKVFEETQALHVAGVERLERELAAGS